MAEDKEKQDELDFAEPVDGGMIAQSHEETEDVPDEVEEVVAEDTPEPAAGLPLDVIEEAIGYGLTSKEIEELGSEENIAAVLQILDRTQTETVSEESSETADDDFDDPFADPDDDAGVDSEIADLRKQVKNLTKLVKTKKPETPNMEKLFDMLDNDYTELFGEDVEEMSKTQERNREKAYEEYEIMKAGYAAKKRRVPSERRLFKQAVQSVFGNFESKVARKQFSETANKRKSQFISRVNSRDNKKPKDSRSNAIDSVKQFLIDRGYNDLSSTENFD
tara:strand:+ start:1007 stop:1840 length:834 start_codon:yes stop_codon:yes gene_type:complete